MVRLSRLQFRGAGKAIGGFGKLAQFQTHVAQAAENPGRRRLQLPGAFQPLRRLRFPPGGMQHHAQKEKKLGIFHARPRQRPAQRLCFAVPSGIVRGKRLFQRLLRMLHCVGPPA